ncbi:MAG: S1/P1 nuclease [Rhodothermales bacterium]
MTSHTAVRRPGRAPFWGAVLVALALLAPASALAWSSNGHMMIAALAYRSLTPEQQAAYAALLYHHPDYESWQQDFEALGVSMDAGEYFFMRASLWPDQIRRRGSPYDHPTWHYTNYPLVADSFALAPSLTPENDVLHGIRVSIAEIGNTRQDAVLRAVHLSWLIHLIGDLHQPLHAATLVNADYPRGDRGGNDFFVRPRPNREGMNLHAFWDQLLGTSANVREVRNQATLLGRTYTRMALLELGEATDPTGWALESRRYAIDAVYLAGQLQGEVEDRRSQAPVLPEEYPLRAKQVAERRAALAAYRLADVLADI